nr:MAG: capsid protein [Cressdnaviricota sp.]
MPRPRSKHLRYMMDEMFTAGYHAAALPFGLSSKDILGMVTTRAQQKQSQSWGAWHPPMVPVDDVMAADDIHSGATTCNIHISPTLKPAKQTDYSVANRLDECYGLTPIPINEGTQNVRQLCTVGDVANWLSTNTSLTASPQINYSNVNYFSLNPDVGTTGSNVTYTGATTWAAKKQVLSHAEVVITVSNQSANPAYVDLYCCEAKQNIMKSSSLTTREQYVETGCIEYWISSLDSSSMGLGAQSTVSGAFGYEGVTQPGAIPSLRGFKDMYKIRSVHHLTLAGASEETVNYNCPLNMKVDGLKMIQENMFNGAHDNLVGDLTTVQCRVGLRRHGLEFWLIVRGGILKQAGSSGAVSYGTGELGVVVQRKLLFHPMKNRENGIQTHTAQLSLETSGGATLKKVTEVDTVVTQSTTIA